MVNNLVSKGGGVKGAYEQPLKAPLPYGMLATKKRLADQVLSTHAINRAVKTETLLLLTAVIYIARIRRCELGGRSGINAA